MRFNKLDLNLLVSLDALLSEMSVTRAAKRLHVTQSAMSSSLARLRDYFEDELLVQVGRRMEMTARAQRLQNEVRDLLARIDSTLAADRDFDPTTADRRVTLQCSDYALQTVIPVALALAEAQKSRVRFELVPVTEERALERGEVDLMILPRAYCSVQHEAETLMFEDMLCVMWRENPLAEGELTFQRYMAASHVIARPLFSAPPVFDTWFADTYSRPRPVDVVTYSLASLPHLVVGSHRIATVHGRLARRAAAGLPVVLRPVPAPIPALELAMQWPYSRSEHGVLKWLRSLMHQAMEELDRSLPPLA